MQTVRGIGVELAYYERGAGPDVLLIHGLAADALGFEAHAEALAPYARVVAYDRRGYGGSEAPASYERTTVEEQSEDAVALLGGLHVERALIVGDGFGALIALDLLKRHAGRVSAAVLSDPPAFAFVPAATEALAKQREALGVALAQGGPEAAVEAWLGARVQGEQLARARTAHRAFFADYAGLATLELTRAQLRSIAVPVVVLTGPYAPPTITAAADRLAELIPDVRRAADGDIIGAALTLLGAPGP